MDESKLQEIEDRANETVLRCVRCDAPARWRDHSVAGIPGGGEDWVCNDHVANRREAHDIATVELDALDLVAEVRCLRAQLAVHQSATDAAVDGVRAMLPAALATARREGAEEMRSACMEACRDALRDPSDIAIIGRVAEAIRALPLDAPGGAT